jgi:hypothetical protein
LPPKVKINDVSGSPLRFPALGRRGSYLNHSALHFEFVAGQGVIHAVCALRYDLAGTLLPDEPGYASRVAVNKADELAGADAPHLHGE